MLQILSIALTDTFGTPAFLKAFAQPMRDAAARNPNRTFAQSFTGVRHDSGDALHFISLLKQFYHSHGIDGKTIIFSDALNVDKCIEYKKASEAAGFKPSFGIGTFLTNDFRKLTDGAKSEPLNIVIKLGSAAGRCAVKISDSEGKHTGDAIKIAEVKHRLGYIETEWSGGDESRRWT